MLLVITLILFVFDCGDTKVAHTFFLRYDIEALQVSYSLCSLNASSCHQMNDLLVIYPLLTIDECTQQLH